MDKTRSEVEETQPAEVVREYGPFEGASRVHGVTFDGAQVWFAGGETLHAFDPASGEPVRTLAVACDAGTAFDGRYLFQLGGGLIRKIDPETGQVLKTLPAPGNGSDSGLTWAEGSLWVGEYRGRRIHRIDPETGAILRTIESNRFVTGVTWAEGELWHGTLEDGASDIRRLDPADGRVLVRLTLPEGMSVTGLEADKGDLFYAGGGASGKVRAVRRPRRSRR
ncbi:PQQ-binding-like beta-propeller repeat protein [Myxococcus sp. CA051A]|uniref:Vgb family protein n=1 Tax=unclassified Myxococcus TaxID=2648731 RepID=UPI00157AA2A1|nr:MULTISPECIES: PQQ-binding-like beta-propeller repeat protein [unclassified Myxococcus]NTX15001.1 PQQ-binding-like beta-propeller repeat protein [Myxococcus sp. CA056]NTX63736.1 PQQ-binding-like beta-propeller repeat protein [Myxococcus sp. CA051A]